MPIKTLGPITSFFYYIRHHLFHQRAPVSFSWQMKDDDTATAMMVCSWCGFVTEFEHQGPITDEMKAEFNELEADTRDNTGL